MCGLAFTISKRGKPAGYQTLNLYDKQASRGRQGFGYLAIKNGKLVSVQRAKIESDIRAHLMAEDADIVLFHHRLPTSTKNTLGTTHPIFVSNKELKNDYYFAHNGVITNDNLLKDKHEDLGYVYTTEFIEKTVAHYKDGKTEILESDRSVFNDSEVLAIELARYIEGISNTVATTGGAAFWGISLEKGTDNVIEIFFGKNKGRDLKMSENKKWLSVSSETGNDITEMKIFSFEVADKDKVLYERKLEIDEAKPIEVKLWDKHSMGFHHPDTEDYNTPTNYSKLQNSYYTLEQVINSGVSMSLFFETKHNNIDYWVPEKFKGVVTDRDLYNPKYIQLPLPPADPKDMEKLEELAIQYAKLEEQLFVIDSWKDEGKINESIYKFRTDYISKQLRELEEKMYTLGIDEEVIESKIEEAKQLQDYSSSLREDEQDLPLQIS